MPPEYPDRAPDLPDRECAHSLCDAIGAQSRSKKNKAHARQPIRKSSEEAIQPVPPPARVMRLATMLPAARRRYIPIKWVIRWE